MIHVISTLGWSLFLNLRIFDLSPPHFVHYFKKVIRVEFGHDYSPLSRAPRGLNISEKGCFVIFFDNIQKNIAFILKIYKTYIIDIYIFIKTIFIQYLINLLLSIIYYFIRKMI
jgi:hypothetical protein